MLSGKEKVIHITKPEHSDQSMSGEIAEESVQDTHEQEQDAAGDALHAEAGQSVIEEAAEEIAAPKKAGRDMGKAAVFISILTVLLLVVFFYALNRNMAGLASQVEELTALRTQVTDMGGTLGSVRDNIGKIEGDIATMQEKMTILDAVPSMAKRTMLRSMLHDLSQRADFIAQETEDGAQSAKIRAAMELLGQVESQMAE